MWILTQSHSQSESIHVQISISTTSKNIASKLSSLRNSEDVDGADIAADDDTAAAAADDDDDIDVDDDDLDTVDVDKALDTSVSFT